MSSMLSLLAFAVMLTAGLPHPVSAQQTDAVYVVSYIEALPSSAAQTRELLATYAEESRRAGGNVQFEVLQRIGRPNHFAILEEWKNSAAHAARSRSANARRFHTDLRRLLYSPPDRRDQRALLTAARRRTGPDAVYVLTHVDIVPPRLEQGLQYLRELAEASRSETGNVRFDVLVTGRKNHMTIVEVWESAAAQQAHLATAHYRTFRGKLLPLLGALYDERLYRGL